MTMALDAHRETVVELRDPLHGPIPLTAAELEVVDAPHFQRLRRVKQLGFADMVFPGAVHNRYLHSIGAMHLAGRVFDRLGLHMGWLSGAERARLRQTVRLAALLHDIGHPPLSHAAEALLPDREALAVPGRERARGRASHEDMTLKLILDSGLTAVLERSGAEHGVTPRHVAALIEDDVAVDPRTFVAAGRDHRPLLHGLVSGELDVDRMDYLLRDSYFAGVGYGRYDLDWLLSNLRPLADPSSARPTMRVGLDVRAVPAFEHFLLARYHMFQMVYFHAKSDIYDAMLRRWLDAVGPEARFPADPEAYVACDDAWLHSRLAASDDPWARRIREQRPLALVRELRVPLSDTRRAQVDAALQAAGVERIWLRAKPVLSRYARSPAHLRTDPLLVSDGDRLSRIEEVTDLFGRYDRTIQLQRLYVDREQRPRAGQILDAP